MLVAAAGIVTAAVMTTTGSSASDASPIAAIQPFHLAPVVPGAPPATLGTTPARPTVVTFFAAWCDPCRAELPLIEAASRRPGAPVVVGIDVLDQRPDAQILLAQANVTFPAGFDHDGSTSQKWGIDGLPVTVFVAPGGKIVSYHRGQLDVHELDRLLVQLAAASR